MTHYGNTIGKSSRGAVAQTGASSSGIPTVTGELASMDKKVPVDEKGALVLEVKLAHDFEYISSGDPNHATPERANLINEKGFILGAGGGVLGTSAAAAAGTSAALAVPTGGASLVAGAALGLGAVVSAASGLVESWAGGFGFNVLVEGKKEGTDEWVPLGQATPTLAAAGLLDNSSATVELPFYSPPEPGEWDVRVLIGTIGGQKISEYTRDVTVEAGSKHPDGGDGDGGDGPLGGSWLDDVINNPVKAGVAMVGGSIVLRQAIGGD